MRAVCSCAVRLALARADEQMRDAPFHRAGRRVTAAVDHPLRKHMHPRTCARTGSAVLFRLGR